MQNQIKTGGREPGNLRSIVKHMPGILGGDYLALKAGFLPKLAAGARVAVVGMRDKARRQAFLYGEEGKTAEARDWKEQAEGWSMVLADLEQGATSDEDFFVAVLSALELVGALGDIKPAEGR